MVAPLVSIIALIALFGSSIAQYDPDRTQNDLTGLQGLLHYQSYLSQNYPYQKYPYQMYNPPNYQNPNVKQFQPIVPLLAYPGRMTWNPYASNDLRRDYLQKYKLKPPGFAGYGNLDVNALSEYHGSDTTFLFGTYYAIKTIIAGIIKTILSLLSSASSLFGLFGTA